MTIIVEQQINCQVTHVESLEKFYIHLDIDKAALVEAAMDGYDKALVRIDSWVAVRLHLGYPA